MARRDGPKSENSPRAIDTGGRDDCNSCEKRESRFAYRRHSPYPQLRTELRDEAKRREHARRESHSETRVSRAGGVIPRSRGPRQDTSAKPRRERGSSGFVRFRQRSALPDTPGRRSSLPTRDERPRQSARPTDASATPCRKVPFSLRSRGSSRRSECLLNHCSSRSSTRVTRVGLRSYRGEKSTKKFSQCSIVLLGIYTETDISVRISRSNK